MYDDYRMERLGREDVYRKFTPDLSRYLEEAPLSESRKKLLFDYKIRFARIRNQERSGWKKRQGEFQRRLANSPKSAQVDP